MVSLSAALYAVAISVTAPIPTPWGVGHFRPGVVVPAVFAVVTGPYVAGIGAALGTFVGSVVLSSVGLSNPLLSLVAGVPGNFAGFFLLGWLCRRGGWRMFVAATLLSLLVGNFIAASGVLLYFSYVVPTWAGWPPDVKLATILGLTLFWMVTMVPFILPLVPALLRVLKPFSGRSLLRVPSWPAQRPTELIPISLTISVILVMVFAAVMFTALGDLMFARVVSKEAATWAKWLILISALIVAVFGPLSSTLKGRP
jgi:hypothetical protein